jgi:lipid-A-disaccharide synthase
MIPGLGASHRNNLRIMIVAGEASGDKHGAALARSLSEINADKPAEIFGSGGDEMRAAGVETLIDARDVAVMGVPEIARAIGRFYRAYRTLLSAALSRKPDAVVLIDWPDFNLRFARRLHHYGFKVIYYISPQVWAWRRYRVKAIRRLVDRMLVILPFEREFYQRYGIDAEYVGHPLAGSVSVTATREEFAARHKLDPSGAIIALLPGSRKKEIHYHVPPMVKAAAILSESMAISWEQLLQDTRSGRSSPAVAAARERAGPEVFSAPQYVIPLASTVDLDQVRSLIGSPGCNVTIVERDTYNALGHSCFAIVASGTATIETALLGTPMVIVYKASELNFRLIRPLIHLDTFGMANLIAGKKIIPELIQRDVTGPKIAEQVLSIVGDPARLARMREDLAEVRRLLDTTGVPGHERAARAVMNAIQS